MKNYLEKFTHNHNSFIFGEYTITYQVYEVVYEDKPSIYGIKLSNDLTESEHYFENYSTHDEAVEDIHRIDRLEVTFERQFAEEFY